MRFTNIKGVIVNSEISAVIINLETVTKIELDYRKIGIAYINGNRDDYAFDDHRQADAEFDRLEKLIYEIQ